MTRPDRPLLIAIDGPAGAGKSTIARRLAARLGLPYLDTGAMYRAVGWLAVEAGLLPPWDEPATAALAELAAVHTIELDADPNGRARVAVDGQDVTSQIRTPECSTMASAVSTVPGVRRVLVARQQQLGRERGGVMEGRDIGTVVFPDADLKIFLTAAPRERARRRQLDLAERGIDAALDEVSRELTERDERDSTRADSPLQKAADAVEVDTSGLSPDEVLERLVREVEHVVAERGGAG